MTSPEVDTATPPEPMTATSIVKTVKDAIDNQLRVPRDQRINAAVALLVGLVMVFDGQLVFKWIVVGTVFVFSLCAALNDVSVLGGLGADDPLRMFVGVEVGAALAYAAYRGFDGMMMLIAFVVGGFVAFGLQQSIALVFHQFQKEDSRVQDFWLFLYSITIVGVMMMVRHGKHARMLVVVSAVAGGLLVSSALCYFCTQSAVHGHMKWLDRRFPNHQPAVPGAWLDFVTMLVHGGKEDFGVLGGLDCFGIPADRVAGCSLWLLVSVIGICIQVSALSRRAAPRGKSTGNLGKPLLG